MKTNVTVTEKSGKITHFLNADYKIIHNVIVVTQYVKDENMGGVERSVSKVFKKSDVDKITM